MNEWRHDDIIMTSQYKISNLKILKKFRACRITIQGNRILDRHYNQPVKVHKPQGQEKMRHWQDQWRHHIHHHQLRNPLMGQVDLLLRDIKIVLKYSVTGGRIEVIRGQILEVRILRSNLEVKSSGQTRSTEVIWAKLRSTEVKEGSKSGSNKVIYRRLQCCAWICNQLEQVQWSVVQLLPTDCNHHIVKSYFHQSWNLSSIRISFWLQKMVKEKNFSGRKNYLMTFLKKMMVTKKAKSFSNISNMSPTYFDCYTRHQHRHFEECEVKIFP